MEETKVDDINNVDINTLEEIKEEIPIKKKNNQNRIIVALSILSIILASALGLIVYTNFDYLLFKTVMTKGYIYDESLQDLIDQELRQSNSDINTYFDTTIINVFMNRLYEVSNDRYTYLYLPVQYTSRISQEQEIGSSSDWMELTEDAAYVFLANFSSEATKLIVDNAEELSQYKYIVLDLRGNGGGYVHDAYTIADMFLENGAIIASETSKINALSVTTKSDSNPIFDFEKIIILQDRNTASASEILIGALNDNLDNVVLLGETTYGKGIGQTTFPLKNGFYFITTMFTWETPNGETIHAKGIEPDREFTLEILGEEINATLTKYYDDLEYETANY